MCDFGNVGPEARFGYIVDTPQVRELIDEIKESWQLMVAVSELGMLRERARESSPQLLRVLKNSDFSQLTEYTITALADIGAVDFSAPELSPCYDPLSHLAYAAGREHVSHVWVNGELLVERGELTRLDSRELAAKARHWKDRIAG